MPPSAKPEAQTLFTVSEETSLGIPPLIWAWRLGNLALPGLEHLTEHHVLHLLGRHLGPLERGRDRRAAEVGGVEGREARRPSLPKGVRAAPRITVLGIWGRSPSAGWRSATIHDTGGLDTRRRPWPLLPRHVTAAAPAGKRRADTRVVALFEGESPGRARAAGAGRPGRGEARAAQGGGRPRGRARRRPAPCADRRSRQARRAGRRARAGGCRRRGGPRQGARRRVALVGQPGRRGRRTAASSRARCCASTASTASSPSATRTPAGGVESLELVGDSVDDAELELARVSAECRERRARPPEPARQRGHAELPGRAARDEIAADYDSLEVEILDRDAIVVHAAWARSRPWPRAPHVEPRLIVLRYRPAAAPGRTSASSARP